MSTEHHLDEATLERLIAGRLLAAEVMSAGAHLGQCIRCRSLLEQLLPVKQAGPLSLRPKRRPDDTSSPYRRIIDKARQELGERARYVAEDLDRGPRLAHELLGLTCEERAARVDGEARLHSPSLAEALLSVCRCRWAGDPAEALCLAQLALGIAAHLDDTPMGPALLNDLRAKAWAYVGNAQRVLSDLRSAEQAFTLATTHLLRGTGDPLARAEVVGLQASLARAQGRFDQALKLLNQVVAAYGKAGDLHLVGRTLLSKGRVHLAAGRPERSIGLLRRARLRVDPEREPRLVLAVEENLALALHESHRTAEALELMPRVREAAAAVGTHLDWLRITWLDGLIALELGSYSEAERCLAEARDGFCAEGIGYDAALVCLDLAALYLRQGRTAETRRLATEMLPIFRSRDIHREALAALMLFRQALELEQVSASMIAELRSYLLPRRGKPALEAEKPS